MNEEMLTANAAARFVLAESPGLGKTIEEKREGGEEGEIAAGVCYYRTGDEKVKTINRRQLNRFNPV